MITRVKEPTRTSALNALAREPYLIFRLGPLWGRVDLEALDNVSECYVARRPNLASQTGTMTFRVLKTHIMERLRGGDVRY